MMVFNPIYIYCSHSAKPLTENSCPHACGCTKEIQPEWTEKQEDNTVVYIETIGCSLSPLSNKAKNVSTLQQETKKLEEKS